LLTATTSAYSGNERLKLHRKIRDREDAPGLLDWILGSLPKWEVNIFSRAKDDAQEIATVAAAAYKPTEKSETSTESPGERICQQDAEKSRRKRNRHPQKKGGQEKGLKALAATVEVYTAHERAPHLVNNALAANYTTIRQNVARRDEQRSKVTRRH
jgi:hypothetical protein